ncbi:MAG: dihydropteroate synthase-like protein [Candidatus Thorarchaeota archaeon]
MSYSYHNFSCDNMEFQGRVLLLTGRMAFDDLVGITSEFDNVEVEALPISVAAFTTPRLVSRHISKFVETHKPDVILVSGLANGDYSKLSEEIGVILKKGTRYLSAVPVLLRNLHDVLPLLSGKKPADDIIRAKIIEELRTQINRIEDGSVFGMRNLRLRSGLSVGMDLPPRVMAEVVDATSRPFESCVLEAGYYSEWADILDVGCTVSKPDPERVSETVTELRKFKLPVSIDTLDPDEILAAVDAGAEIVLSLDRGNFDVAQRIPEDVALVCLPTNVASGIFPRVPSERASICVETCNELRRKGHENLLADPLMEAPINPGLMDSLIAYHHCRKLDPDLPFLAGVGNVTEFVDSDTVGVNSILACLGIELGISVFLSTEERPSTYGCIKELKSAAMMGFASSISKAPPKEIGITSFSAKSSFFEVQSVSDDESYELVTDEKQDYDLDPSGSFRIGIDYRTRMILCEHKGRDGSVHRLKSKSASAILQTIHTRGYVSFLNHAAYLGSELTRAELSLKVGHNYNQDGPWDSELTLDL